MLFLEGWFWAFAAVAIPAYWALPERLRLYWLLAASLVFHWHFAGPAGMAPIALLAALTYFAGIGASLPSGKTLVRIAAAASAGALVFYKYSAFAADNLRALLDSASLAAPRALAEWSAPAAPLAISFFTFEFLHYLYEVRVRGREPIRSPLHFALFAVFFPSLACGPIKRFPDFVPQLEAAATPRLDEIVGGAKRVVRGLFKKVCVADLLVEYIRALEELPEMTAGALAALALLQGLRIYYDFAGYSDIAIGLARTMGIAIPENFDRPYGATTLQEFWRRWHMSLSSWIRDYVYIPLGGNRAHRALNVLAAMALCGLWHGAAWNFAAWGVYHGMGLVAEAGARRAAPRLFANTAPARLAAWAICYAYVMYGWLLFFYPLGAVYEMTMEALGSCCAF